MLLMLLMLLLLRVQSSPRHRRRSMPGLTEIQLERVPGHVESQKAEEVSTQAHPSANSPETGLGSSQGGRGAGHHTYPPTIGRRGASRNSLRATNGRAAMPRYITYTHCTCAMRKSVLLRVSWSTHVYNTSTQINAGINIDIDFNTSTSTDHERSFISRRRAQEPRPPHYRAKRIETPDMRPPAHSLSKEQGHPVIPHHHRCERQERDIRREERREERVYGDVECVAPFDAVLGDRRVGRG
jgi:hypothetical protein